ncbi:hypothetical protein VC83_02154 [Pseudogymnoascus destructans]|uniref:BTB domain-containing protein n=1 Tax=Pseudogymnoascus destructans TaxID=655981 RepID=A0A177AHB9_9PEZI|nr:uncharacterized protein VC83_02154 [Pseudogymnoascus destructans]OAF61476.2 hypothetical protein VC83_02154 [Pseudogymnoascus destructans]
MGQEMVKIIVGEGEGVREFVLHRGLFMDKVMFFEKMFGGGFLESWTSSATLPEDNPEAFEVLAEWIYRSTIKSLRGKGRPKMLQADLAISTVGLEEKYFIPELGDRAMTFLADIRRRSTPTMSQMSTLYKNTHFDSNSRIYAARTVVWALLNPENHGVSSLSIQTACQDSDLLLDAITEEHMGGG